MNIWKLVRLDFGDVPAHFGELGIGVEETAERVRSDTLFGAWVNIYARLFGSGDVEQLLKRFVGEAGKPPPMPPVKMSSTFIYRSTDAKDGQREISYYLPKPLQFPHNYPEEDDLKFFKTYKKLRYLPLKVWQRWYQGEGFDDESELIAKTKGKSKSDGSLSQAGTFDYGKTFKTNKVPKIAVDRATRATNLYHTGFVQFEWERNGDKIKSKSGLYFLLYFPEEDEELEKNLLAALYLLGEEGLGGERSSGAGRFKVEWLELPETWQQVVNFSGGTHHALMSLFWQEKPLPANLLDDSSSYELLERGGWICSSFSGRQLRRQHVWMFGEGSVFPEPPVGELADVTPKQFTLHSVYRNGISLSLPIKV